MGNLTVGTLSFTLCLIVMSAQALATEYECRTKDSYQFNNGKFGKLPDTSEPMVYLFDDESGILSNHADVPPDAEGGWGKPSIEVMNIIQKPSSSNDLIAVKDYSKFGFLRFTIRSWDPDTGTVFLLQEPEFIHYGTCKIKPPRLISKHHPKRLPTDPSGSNENGGTK